MLVACFHYNTYDTLTWLTSTEKFLRKSTWIQKHEWRREKGKNKLQDQSWFLFYCFAKANALLYIQSNNYLVVSDLSLLIGFFLSKFQNRLMLDFLTVFKDKNRTKQKIVAISTEYKLHLAKDPPTLWSWPVLCFTVIC